MKLIKSFDGGTAMNNNSFLDPSAIISDNSKVNFDNTKIYSNTRITCSAISNGVIIGNESRITDSIINEKCEIARRNNIQYSQIGKGTYTGENTVIQRANVGKYCAISWNVSIGGRNHCMHALCLTQPHRICPNKEIYEYGNINKKCTVGNDVWIATGAIILRGVEIGDGAVIGAGSVVTKNVPPYAIVAGVPAKIIDYRFSNDFIARLIKISWWDWSENDLNKCKDIFYGDLTNDKLDILEQMIF